LQPGSAGGISLDVVRMVMLEVLLVISTLAPAVENAIIAATIKDESDSTFFIKMEPLVTF
jgi:hypothetical protein